MQAWHVSGISCDIMFKNFVLIALRNMRRHKGYSFINLSGLVVGFACCLLIAFWIHDELSTDAFHSDIDRTYHVLAHKDFEASTTPALLGPALKEEFPEIEDAVRLHQLFGGAVLTRGDRSFHENGLRSADPSFFSFFTFSFIKGDPRTALQDPHSIVISRASAEKYFAGEDPIGKTLTLNHEHEFTVTGVFENVPDNSTLRFDMVVPMAFLIATSGDWYLDWGNFFPTTFVKLRPGSLVEDVAAKIADVVPAHGGGRGVRLSLLPFRQRYFHFFSNIVYIYIFGGIALLVLVIAGLNFINLSTARSAGRAREIGVRKVSGATRAHLTFRFLGESILLSFIAVVGALLLATAILPFFSALTGRAPALSAWPWIPMALVFALFTGAAAGIYPAFVLSGFQPVRAIKGERAAGRGSQKLRRLLVVVQFLLTISLMIGAFVVHGQFGFIRTADIGYNKDHLVRIPMKAGSQRQFHALKNDLLGDERILAVTATQAGLPFLGWRQSGFSWTGSDRAQPTTVSFNMVNDDFLKTFQIELVEGRDFSREFPADAESGCIVNEAMLKLMGLKNAEGAELRQADRSYRIIGVVRNFHFHSLRNLIEPLVLRFNPETAGYAYVRISPGALRSGLDVIGQAWKQLIPGYPFDYSFMDDEYEIGYRSLKRAETLLNVFALLAVVLSGLGLFGLAAFTAEQRTKELGIRKVLGSGVSGIILLLTKEYMKYVAWAAALAWPLSYFIMRGWLEGFAYRVRLGFGVFILSAIAAFSIALFSVSFQAVRSAITNPVDALRHE
jgi:putative ABC transport system permease protein